MILNYKVMNYKSIGSPLEFTTIPGKYRNKQSHVYESSKYKSLKFSAVFGANASGKSNFIDSLSYLKYSIIRGRIPRTSNDLTFRLEDFGKNTNFEIEVGFEEMILIYGISIDTNNREVNREYLLQNTGTTDKVIYDIENKHINHLTLKAKTKERVLIYFKDLKKDEFLLMKLAEAKDTEKEEIYELSKMLSNWFLKELVIITPKSIFSNKVNQFTKRKDQDAEHSVIDILKTFDTGITDYVYKKMSLEKFIDIIKGLNLDDSEENEEFIKNISEIDENKIIEANVGGDFYKISYDEENNEPTVEVLGFRHCDNNEKYFSYDEESDGTKRLIEIVNVLYSAQNTGKTYVVDEIERSFHSNLTIEFVRKFLNYSKNNKSQLIITTHETNMMDFNLVRQDELWLIDRDKGGKSNLVPLSKYNLRIDKILDKDYLDGRYGGVPNILKIIEDNKNE